MRFYDPYDGKTVQQLDATKTVDVGRLGRTVYLSDENYVVDPRDDLIILEATTSTGTDWEVSFPDELPVNHRVLLVLPATAGGADVYKTSGAAPATTFSTAGDFAHFVSFDGTVLKV